MKSTPVSGVLSFNLSALRKDVSRLNLEWMTPAAPLSNNSLKRLPDTYFSINLKSRWSKGNPAGKSRVLSCGAICRRSVNYSSAGVLGLRPGDESAFVARPRRGTTGKRKFVQGTIKAMRDERPVLLINVFALLPKTFTKAKA